jgi:hypothetical protein
MNFHPPNFANWAKSVRTSNLEVVGPCARTGPDFHKLHQKRSLDGQSIHRTSPPGLKSVEVVGPCADFLKHSLDGVLGKTGYLLDI